MSVNNDIRRIKKALEVFDVEGSNLVMIDIIYEAMYGEGGLNPGKIIERVKKDYMVKLKELQNKHLKNYKQVKINF